MDTLCIRLLECYNGLEFLDETINLLKKILTTPSSEKYKGGIIGFVENYMSVQADMQNFDPHYEYHTRKSHRQQILTLMDQFPLVSFTNFILRCSWPTSSTLMLLQTGFFIMLNVWTIMTYVMLHLVLACSIQQLFVHQVMTLISRIHTIRWLPDLHFANSYFFVS
jgi:hypothetical protein